MLSPLEGTFVGLKKYSLISPSTKPIKRPDLDTLGGQVDNHVEIDGKAKDERVEVVHR